MGFMLAALMAGIAGVVGVAFFTSGDPQSGGGIELYAVAGAVIGGTPLAGGKATVFGAVVGAILLTAVSAGLVYFQIPRPGASSPLAPSSSPQSPSMVSSSASAGAPRSRADEMPRTSAGPAEPGPDQPFRSPRRDKEDKEMQLRIDPTGRHRTRLGRVLGVAVASLALSAVGSVAAVAQDEDPVKLGFVYWETKTDAFVQMAHGGQAVGELDPGVEVKIAAPDTGDPSKQAALFVPIAQTQTDGIVLQSLALTRSSGP